MPKSTTFRIACSTAVMMRPPPGPPTAMNSLPSLVRIVGVIDDNGRLPGWIAFASPCTRPNMFGVPGFAAKSSISLFSRKPSPGAVTPLP